MMTVGLDTQVTDCLLHRFTEPVERSPDIGCPEWIGVIDHDIEPHEVISAHEYGTTSGSAPSNRDTSATELCAVEIVLAL